MSDPLTDPTLRIDPAPEPTESELHDSLSKLAAQLRHDADQLAARAEALATRLRRAHQANRDMARKLSTLEAERGIIDLYDGRK